MQIKNLAAVALLAFVVIALAWALLNKAETPVAEETAVVPAEQEAETSAPGTAAVVPAKAIDNGVVAYYLHPESRCATCLKIEELSKMAIEDGFVEELAGGRLQWLALNVDQPEHKHFMDDFQLHTTSLVLAERKDGETVKFKNCTRVWELVHSPMKFNSYVEEEVSAFLGDA